MEADPCHYSENGAGLTIGLHPASPAHPAAGTTGGIGYGLETYAPAERVLNRYGDHFATVEAGSLVLAIHPKTSRSPDPGKRGSVSLGLQVDEPMDSVVARLTERGVRMSGESAPPDAGQRVEFEDEDGNPIYVWEPRAASSRAAASR